VQIRLDDQYNIKHVNGSKSEIVVTYENYTSIIKIKYIHKWAMYSKHESQ